MKKSIFMLCIFFPGIFSCNAQLIAYGIQGGLAYSHITLTGNDPYLETSGSSIAFQLGLFVKKDITNYFIQAEPTYTGNMGGNWVINDVEDKVTVSSFSLPLIIGKKFMSGIRVFSGLAPYLNITVEEETDFGTFYMANAPVSGLSWGGGAFELKFLLGAGIEVSKITLNLRYEFSFLGDFMNHESDGTTIHHRLPLGTVQLAYRFN
jgi:hypothetical protein